MSGKKIISRWGGSRSGAGRKPSYMLTENQVKAMLRKARKYAKKYDKTIDEVLLDFIYGVQETGWKMTVKDRLAAIGLFKNYTMSKTSEQNVNVNRQVGPAIGLPPKKPVVLELHEGRKENADRETGTEGAS